MYVSTPFRTVFWCTIPLVVDYCIHLNSKQIFSNAQSRTKAIRNPPDEVHDFRLHPGKILPASHAPVAEYIIVVYIRINRVIYVILIIWFWSWYRIIHSNNFKQLFMFFFIHAYALHGDLQGRRKWHQVAGRHRVKCIIYTSYIFIMFILYSYCICTIACI